MYATRGTRASRASIAFISERDGNSELYVIRAELAARIDQAPADTGVAFEELIDRLERDVRSSR